MVTEVKLFVLTLNPHPHLLFDLGWFQNTSGFQFPHLYNGGLKIISEVLFSCCFYFLDLRKE